MVDGNEGGRPKRMGRRLTALSGAMALMAGTSVSTPALADDGWACQVALCASNPGGWMQFSACVPPIQKLITHLALGGGFPLCVGGGFSSAKYTKPKHGRPGSVLFTKTDGTQQYYTVPSQQDVYNAQASTTDQAVAQ